MKVKFRPDIMEEYVESKLWMYDIPVHQPNYYCSRCAEKLHGLYSHKLVVIRFNDVPLVLNTMKLVWLTGLFKD